MEMPEGARCASNSYSVTPEDMAAWRRVMQRRYWPLRLVTDPWWRLATVTLMVVAIALTWRNAPVRDLMIFLTAMNLLFWLAERMPWRPKALAFLYRPYTSPKIYAGERTVSLSRDAIDVIGTTYPGRSLPWSQLKFLQCGHEELVFLFRPRLVGFNKFLVVPRRAFPGPEHFDQFCRKASEYAASSRRKVYAD